MWHTWPMDLSYIFFHLQRWKSEKCSVLSQKPGGKKELGKDYLIPPSLGIPEERRPTKAGNRLQLGLISILLLLRPFLWEPSLTSFPFPPSVLSPALLSLLLRYSEAQPFSHPRRWASIIISHSRSTERKKKGSLASPLISALALLAYTQKKKIKKTQQGLL